MAEITSEKSIKSARHLIEHMDVEKFLDYPDAENFIEYRSIKDFLDDPLTLRAMKMSLAETYALLYPAPISYPSFLSDLIAESRESKEAWVALSLIAQDLLREGRSLPPELAEWVADVLADHLGEKKKPEKEKRRPRPAKSPRRLSSRNQIICLFIGYLIGEFDLKATRNAGDPPLSACDVVAAAITESAAAAWSLDYKTVERIWSERDFYRGSFLSSSNAENREDDLSALL